MVSQKSKDDLFKLFEDWLNGDYNATTGEYIKKETPDVVMENAQLKQRLGELEDLVDMDLFPCIWPDDEKDFRELMRRYAMVKQAVHRAYFNKHGRDLLLKFINESSDVPSRDKEKYCKDNGVEFPNGFSFSWDKPLED